MALFASGAKISHGGLLWPVLVVGKPLGLNDLRERGALLERVSHDHVTIALAVAEDPRSQSSTAQLDGNLDYKRVPPAKLMPTTKTGSADQVCVAKTRGWSKCLGLFRFHGEFLNRNRIEFGSTAR